jgi:hypothetical protein
MKKVGLITTHFAINYGAVLQAYALQQVIKQMGLNVEIINYNPKVKHDGRKVVYKWNNIKSIVLSLFKLLNFKYRISHYRKIKLFNDFIYNNLNLSGETITEEIENQLDISKYDFLVCGSDQIWNQNLFNNPVYFLNFGFDYGEEKRISYAPSIAEVQTEAQVKRLLNYVKYFDSVSIREELYIEQLKSVKPDTIIVLDPIFLPDNHLWLEKIGKPIINGDYIFCYSIGASSTFSNLVKNVKNQTGLDVVYVNTKPYTPNFADKNLRSVSPFEFLNLLYYSKFVVTSSFHGVAFSIKFKKQFYTSTHEDRRSRHIGLLKSFDLIERYIYDYDSNKIDCSLEIDYEKTNPKIEKHINQSLDYLLKSLAKK